MALAARCPECQALFRVVIDQLKLRDGLVRCGACHTVFDAIGALSYVVDEADAAARNSRPQPGLPRTDPGQPAAVPDQRADPEVPAPVAMPAPSAEPQNTASAEVGPGTESAAVAVDAAADDAPPAPDALPEDTAPTTHHATTDVTNEAATAAVGTESIDANAGIAHAADAPPATAEPSFLRVDRDRRRVTSRALGAAGVLLAALLAAQLALVWRNEIYARAPSARPTLESICRAVGCAVGWPSHSEALAVISTELQQLPNTDQFELTAVIRNRSRFGVALPAIELTLTDAANTMLARRVLLSAEYLASAGEPITRIDAGLGADEDLTIHARLSIPQMRVAGFVVYPFYP